MTPAEVRKEISRLVVPRVYLLLMDSGKRRKSLFLQGKKFVFRVRKIQRFVMMETRRRSNTVSRDARRYC
jgi:hypothetical protein